MVGGVTHTHPHLHTNQSILSSPADTAELGVTLCDQFRIIKDWKQIEGSRRWIFPSSAENQWILGAFEELSARLAPPPESWDGFPLPVMQKALFYKTPNVLFVRKLGQSWGWVKFLFKVRFFLTTDVHVQVGQAPGFIYFIIYSLTALSSLQPCPKQDIPLVFLDVHNQINWLLPQQWNKEFHQVMRKRLSIQGKEQPQNLPVVILNLI